LKRNEEVEKATPLEEKEHEGTVILSKG